MIPIAKPSLTQDEAQAAYDAVMSGWVTQGPRVQEFEQRFAEYVGAAHAVAVSSCTTALHLALIVAGVGPGDEVICPSYTFIATANAVRYVGAMPVFADISLETGNLDPASVRAAITPRTKAILIVHQIGLPADIDEFQLICRANGLALIEDAACAIGSRYQGRPIGSHSELVCFSFHPRKVITTGDGGMIATSRSDYADRLKLLRQHAMTVNDLVRHASRTVLREEYVELGYNYRMTDIQAAVGIKQLEKLDGLVRERRRIAAIYTEAFSRIASVRTPVEPAGSLSNFQSYALYLKQDAPITRDALMERLLAKEIASRRGIMTIHREPAYTTLCAGLSLPVTEDCSDRSILLPLYVGMTDAEIDAVVQAVLDAFSAASDRKETS